MYQTKNLTLEMSNYLIQLAGSDSSKRIIASCAKEAVLFK